jgi:hypothetical protein
MIAPDHQHLVTPMTKNLRGVCVIVLALAVLVSLSGLAQAEEQTSFTTNGKKIEIGDPLHLEVKIERTVKGVTKKVTYQCDSQNTYDALKRVAGQDRKVVILMKDGKITGHIA